MRKPGVAGKSGTSERVHGKDFGRCCALKHGRRCGGVCGRRAEKRSAAESCLRCRRGREEKRGTRQPHNGPSAEGGKAKRRQSDARHGADRRRRRQEGAEGKKAASQKGAEACDAATLRERFRAAQASGLFPDGRSPLRPLAPGWNARSCRGVRKVRAGDRIPRRKRVRAIRWRHCRRALPRPGVQTSCPLPRRASA